MKTRTRFVVLFVAAAFCLALIVAASGAITVFAWASDLPNRISVQIDDEVAGEAVTRFVTESARASLTAPDPKQQLECLQAMADGMETNPESIPWIQTEFAVELAALQASPDAKVATLASEVVSVALPQPTTQGDG